MKDTFGRNPTFDAESNDINCENWIPYQKRSLRSLSVGNDKKVEFF